MLENSQTPHNHKVYKGDTMAQILTTDENLRTAPPTMPSGLPEELAVAAAGPAFRNKVAESGIVTLNLEELLADVLKTPRVLFDLAPILHMGLILREADLRAFCKTHDWSAYAGKAVAIGCSADAIVPRWAFMLVAVHLAPVAVAVGYPNLAALDEALLTRAMTHYDFAQHAGARVVVKGCGDGEEAVSTSAYVAAAAALVKAGARSVMYGEPCSTVPLYKGGAAAARNQEA